MLQPAVANDKVPGQAIEADVQLRKWQSDNSTVLVSMRVGSFDLHFGAKVVVSEHGNFGYKAVQGNLFCTTSPHECDHAEVLNVDGYILLQVGSLSIGTRALLQIGIDYISDFFLAVVDEIPDPVMLFCRFAFNDGPHLYDLVMEHAIRINAKGFRHHFVAVFGPDGHFGYVCLKVVMKASISGRPSSASRSFTQ